MVSPLDKKPPLQRNLTCKKKMKKANTHLYFKEPYTDCQMVVARGMGPRIYQDLASAGSKGLVTDIPMIEEAAERLASGEEIPEVEGECER